MGSEIENNVDIHIRIEVFFNRAWTSMKVSREMERNTSSQRQGLH